MEGGKCKLTLGKSVYVLAKQRTQINKFCLSGHKTQSSNSNEN